MKFVTGIFFLLLVTAAHAADRYATTVAEINQFCESAKAGDKVVVKNGVYTDAEIRFFNINGNVDEPVIVMAETPGKVFFEGNSTLSFSGGHIIVQGFTWQNGGKDIGTRSVIEIKASYSYFQDCALIAYNNKDYSIDNKWVSIYGKYNTVTRCLLKNKENFGATLVVWLTDGEAAHHTICYNYFLNRINGPNADNGLESIRIGDSKTSFTNAHCVTAFNRFENCDGEIEIISNKSCHNSYFHNTFYNNNGGLTLRHGNDCLVDGNVFDGGEKEKSYGVRIIGQGHTVINNYFYHLKGAVKEPFRAPLTIVNGLENTPINGYFQVRRAVVAGNVFVNNVTPNVRVGARSKREGMTIAPDTVSILQNIFFDDECVGDELYEDLSSSQNVTMRDNAVIGKCLKVPKNGFVKSGNGTRHGFDLLKDKNGKIVAFSEANAKMANATNAGADWIHPEVQENIQKKRYTLLSPKEVGPTWMR